MLGKEGNFPVCPQEMAGRCSFPGTGVLAWSASPPQSSERPKSAHCPSDCASPCAWESPDGMVSRGGGLLGTLLSSGFSGFSCNLLPRLPPSPSLRQCLCLPLGLPPWEEGLPTLKALCVGLASRSLVGTGRLDNHRWHLDKVQGTLVVFQGLSQI